MKYRLPTKADTTAEPKRRFGLGKKDRRAIFWLGIITVLTHFHWIFTFKVFTSGDWWFLSLDKYRDFVTMSPVWVTDAFGGTSATPGFYLVRFFEGLLTFFGSNFAVNEKLFFFLPIMIGGTFGAYLFLRQYFKEWLAFIGSIVFAFNTAMLFNYAGALTIAVADALTPIALYLFRQLLRNPRDVRWLLATALTFSVMAVYEMRITLLVIGIAGGFFLFMLLTSQDKKQYIRERVMPLAKLGGLLFLLQAFWLIPYVIGSRSGVTFSNLLEQDLFASFSNVQNALTLQHPFWTNARPATFITQPIPLYAWLIPIAAFGGLLFRRRHTNREIGYWALLAVLGLFLVKQVNEPLVNAYPWIFAHVPGFAAFRESSKFYLLISISYAVLIPYTLAMCKAWLHARLPQSEGHSHLLRTMPWAKVLYIGASVGVLLLFAVNMRPLLTGELRTLYVPRNMPQEYQAFNAFMGKQPDYFRVMWMPAVSRWAAQSSLHPSVNATNLSQGEWMQRLSNDDLPAGATLRDKATNVFSQKTSDDFLDRASVKYVVVPLRDTANEDDFFQRFGDDRQYYLDVLDKLDYLKRVDIGTGKVAVYENRGYQSHVSASADLQTFDLSGSVKSDALHAFTTEQLDQQFNFVDGSTSRKVPNEYSSTEIRDVFQDMTATNVQDGSASVSLAAGKTAVLYANTASQDLRYRLQDNVMTFYRKLRGGLTVNGQAIGPAAGQESAAATQRLVPGGLYILSSGEQVLTFDAKQNMAASLGTPSGAVTLYAATGGNGVPNGSFEQGLWSDKVQDCNAHDKEAYIEMGTGQDAGSGKTSLQFDVDSHTACTATPEITVAGKSMLLRLNHRVIGGQRAGYEVVFNDPAKTRVKHDIDSSGSWQTEERLVSVPEGATTYRIRLFGYPDYRFRNHATINYDDIQAIPVARLVQVPKAQPVYTPLPLPGGNLDFAYAGEGRGGNRIQNGSFTEGLWQKKVADCNNYDPNPAIGMKLIERKDAAANYKALELSARRHAACTTKQKIGVEQGKRYLFSFDYQSPNASRASYTITFNDARRSKIEGSLRIRSTEWQTVTKKIQPPLGATEMNVTVYAYGGDSGTETFINRYGNFQLNEVAITDGQYYLVNPPSAALRTPASITSEKRGATKETIHVKGASTAFYLAQSESYNPLWRLALNNSTSQGFVTKLIPWAKADAVPNNRHFRLNDYQNGWFVDPAQLCASGKAGCTKHADGTYDLELTAEFLPQRWFYIGSVISFTATVCILAYLLYGRRKQLGRQKKGSPSS